VNSLSARKNLFAVAGALERAGIRAFLVDGTLLGAIREGDFIAHDRDVDLGVFAAEHVPEIPALITAAGIPHLRTYGTLERGLQYAFRARAVKVDLFFYYADAAGYFHAAWKDDQPIRYGYPPFSLAPLTFLGRPFLAPADPERFLRTKYGPDWRRPVKDWDWAWGPRNAVPWADAPQAVTA
jgi:hypothetical protein